MQDYREKFYILGHCWPEVDGVAYLLQKTYKQHHIITHYSLSESLDYVEKTPNEWVILTVQPHAYAYFLYQMTVRYPHANILALADKLYFSDMVVLDSLKIMGFTFNDFIQRQYAQIFNLPDRKSHGLPYYNKDKFIKYINEKIRNTLHTRGVSFSEKEVLTMLVNGYSNEQVGRLMRISNKTVSTHKMNGLMKLPYAKDRFALSKGLRATCYMPTDIQ
ncbi:LuxR C-terminal-related transcriptional regulator [Hafnia paralvei]|uniref:LuxR C-terminal-related transcriptional regulator n=1 Tax=Hafnia paralvei TaxID=546367 RepID=UPI0027BAF12F|nr:LuxR C-terminal-related transcriptional regulator [Hafnia paralvei]